MNISDNGLEAKDAGVIAKALRNNTTLTELDISKNNLQDDGAKHIASIFLAKKVHEQSDTSSSSNPANKTLTELNISSNNYIANKGAKCLAKAIERSESLVWLDISDNIFEDESVNYIANALAKSKFLKTLKVVSIYMSFSDSKKILDALIENRSLEELSLHYSGTQNEMAECIADALKNNKSLKTLDILLPEDTSIEYRILLYKAIEKNTTLEKILLRKGVDNYILMSDIMPTKKATGCHTDNQSSEFRRIEITAQKRILKIGFLARFKLILL